MIYGDRILFQGVTLHFNARRRYGLVGANGAGKTTLLNILKGKQEASAGTVQMPKGIRVGMLDQDYFRFGDKPLLDLVLMGDDALWTALQKKESLLSKGKLSPTQAEELGQIEDQINLRGGYRAEARGAQLLSGLGIVPQRHRMPLNTLSGGYKLRVLLAQVLFIEPEVLLLDEPTNYLDIFSIRWLEGYLQSYPGTLILSSHDRFFLNQVCQEIIDIDYGEIRRYIGNFDQFIQEKKRESEIKENELRSIARRKKEIQQFIERFKAKASKARQAVSKERMITKLEKEEESYLVLSSSRQYPRFHFPICRPSGRLVLQTKEIEKSFVSHPVLKSVTFEVEREEKVALVGPNGMGKSTLLEIITGRLREDKGSFRFGPHVKWTYFPQDYYRLLAPEMNLYEWLSGISKNIPEQNIRRTLGQMLFDEYDLHKKIAHLSGGEAARLVFAYLILSEHNLIILDEPTNHLDMESVDALITALKEYKGSVLMVSHNRYFISETANRILELRPNEILDFRGGYEEFIQLHERDYVMGKKREQSQIKKEKIEEKKGARRERIRLEREIAKLEEEIKKIEQEIEEIHQTLAAPKFYEKTPLMKQQEFIRQKVNIERKREELLNQWEIKLEEFDQFL